MGKMIWDVSRVVDYLERLPEVDPRRIGSIGHSHGAYTTLFATALEPRHFAGHRKLRLYHVPKRPAARPMVAFDRIDPTAWDLPARGREHPVRLATCLRTIAPRPIVRLVRA